MRILFPVVEYKPIISFGSLGEEIENLVSNIKELSDTPVDIAICLPFYKSIFSSNYKIKPFSNEIVYISGLAVSFWKTEVNDITVYLIKNDEFFSFREYVYGYSDDNYRFTLFSMAVIHLIRLMEKKPEIIHIHDWHTSLIPLLLEINKIDIKTVLTVHDAKYQGISDINLLNFANINYQYFSTGIIEFYNSINILKAGLFFASHVTTSSKFYLKELQENYQLSYGLNGVLKIIESKSTGISSGIESSYNPETDKTIKCNYNSTDISGKTECKTALQKEFDLPVHSEIPLLIIPSIYITDSERWLLNTIIPYLIKMEIQIIIFGYKLADFEKNIRELSFRLNCTVVSVEKNDENMRKIFSGADILLDTSMEGANDELIKTGLMYGVLPIVFKESPDLEIESNKFRMFNFTTEDLINTIKYTINRYYHLEKWNEKVKKVMEYDFSWHKSVEQYIELYEDILERD